MDSLSDDNQRFGCDFISRTILSHNIPGVDLGVEVHVVYYLDRVVRVKNFDAVLCSFNNNANLILRSFDQVIFL